MSLRRRAARRRARVGIDPRMRVERDAQPAGVGAGLVGERAGGRWGPERVAVGVARHHVEERGRVGDGAGQRSVDREERVREWRVRDAATRRLEPDDPAPGGGVANRAAAVRALRDGAQSRRDRRRRPARGAAAAQLRVPRVAPGRVRGRFADVRQPELGGDRLADDDESGGPDSGDGVVVVVGDAVVPGRGGIGRADARGVVEVLDRDRDAEERREAVTAGRELALRIAGACAREVTRHGQVRTDLRIDALDALEVELDELGG